MVRDFWNTVCIISNDNRTEEIQEEKEWVRRGRERKNRRGCRREGPERVNGRERGGKERKIIQE